MPTPGPRLLGSWQTCTRSRPRPHRTRNGGLRGVSRSYIPPRCRRGWLSYRRMAQGVCDRKTRRPSGEARRQKLDFLYLATFVHLKVNIPGILNALEPFMPCTAFAELVGGAGLEPGDGNGVHASTRQSGRILLQKRRLHVNRNAARRKFGIEKVNGRHVWLRYSAMYCMKHNAANRRTFNRGFQARPLRAGLRANVTPSR